MSKKTLKMTKGNATAGAGIAMFALYLFTFLADNTPGKTQFLALAPVLIDAMKWIVIAYLGVNVIDNGVKGAFYQPGLAGGLNISTEEK
jgi:hypothetical protein